MYSGAQEGRGSCCCGAITSTKSIPIIIMAVHFVDCLLKIWRGDPQGIVVVIVMSIWELHSVIFLLLFFTVLPWITPIKYRNGAMAPPHLDSSQDIKVAPT